MIRRSAWLSERAQRDADARSAEAARRFEDIACVHSFVVEECDRTLGSFCVVEASSPEAVRRHAAAADLPVDEIVRVADRSSVAGIGRTSRPERGDG